MPAPPYLNVLALLACGVFSGLLAARPSLAQHRPTEPRHAGRGQPVATAQPARPLRVDAVRHAPGVEGEDESFYAMITGIVLENLPEDYEDKKHWGKTKEVWRGLRFSGKPFEMKMNSRKKEVNHGTWTMYRITLVKPKYWFRTRVENVRGAGSGRVGFDVIVEARVHGFARLAQWESGVQLVSLSADGEADVRLRLRCEVGFGFDMVNILPAVSVEPEVTDADLQLIRFRVRRISQLGGALAHELGKGLRGVLEHKIESKRHKMVEKINRQIEKKKDKLRFSLAELGQSAWDEIADAAGL